MSRRSLPKYFRHLLLPILIVLAVYSVAAAEGENPQDNEAQPFTQGEIIVIGKKTAAERTASIQEIGEEEIRAMGARNAADILKMASSTRIDTAPTSVSSNGKAEFLASLRGFDPRDVIVLIDGIPVYEPYFRVLDLRQIPAGDISKIQVIKGPTSVLYGPNALGGVINIITKKGATAPHARLQASYGTVQNFLGQGEVYGGSKGFEYFSSAGFERSDGFPVSANFKETRNENGDLRENSDFMDYFLSGKFGYSKPRYTVAASVSHYQFQGGVPFSMEAIDPSTLWRKDWRKTTAAIHGEVSAGDYFTMRGKFFYTNFYNTITSFEDATMSSVLDDSKAVSTYDNNVWGWILMPEFSMGKAGSITLSQIYKADMVRIQDEKGASWNDFGAETYSGGCQYDLTIWKIGFVAGAAYHLYRRTKTPTPDLGKDNGTVDYQAGLSYEPWSFIEFHAAGARKSAFPDLKTLYGSEGNPNLKPEYAYNVDAGFRLRFPPMVSFDTAFFYSDVKDLIGEKDTGNEFTYENIDQAQIRGVETLIDLAFFKDILRVSANYTYMNTRDMRSYRILKSLDFRPEHTAAVDGRVALPFGTHFAVQYFFVGPRRYELPTREQDVRTLPEYGIVNARIGHIVKWDSDRVSCDLYIEAKNIFDVYYEESPEKAAAGRTIYGGLEFAF